MDGETILDNASLLSAHAFSEELCQGFAESIQAITKHADQFKSLLSALSGFQTRYQPFLNINEVHKLVYDLTTAGALQCLHMQRVTSYVNRLARRLTLSGEVSQRWLDSDQQEPVVSLSQVITRESLKLGVPVFRGVLGERSVGAQNVDGSVERIDDAFFNTDALEMARQNLTLLKKPVVRKSFIQFAQVMLKGWLDNELVPGGEMPEPVRQAITGHRGQTKPGN